jgi:uncharacterized protein (TIGR03000 family)
MFRRWFTCGVPALALLTVLCAATPASAQRWGGGRGYYGGGYGSNYGPGYYGGGYYGDGYGGNRYLGNRLNAGGSYGDGYAAYDTGYDTGCQHGVLAEQSTNQGYASFYRGPDANIPQNAALMQVRLPENAELWIADEKTQQTGTLRAFVTPELTDNQRGSYTLRAKWTNSDGQNMDQTRRIQVQPGAQVMVDFFRPAQNQQGPERIRPGASREGDQERAKPREDSEKGTNDKPAPAPAPKNDQKKQDKNQDTTP